MYDPAGQRVRKNSEVIFYGVEGNLLATSAGGYNVYFGKKLIYNSTAAVVTDRLGSVVKIDSSTTTRYFPYGDEPTATQQDRPKFATYYRDGSTALDYAQQRYYASTLARFTSPDPYMASGGPADPQSWNRYAYVQNDPVNANDPSGLMYNLVLGGMYGDDFRLGPAFSEGFWPFHGEEGWTTRYGLALTPGSPVAVPGTGGGVTAPPPREFVFDNVADADQLIRNAITGLAAFLTYASGRDCANWLQTGLAGSDYGGGVQYDLRVSRCTAKYCWERQDFGDAGQHMARCDDKRGAGKSDSLQHRTRVLQVHRFVCEWQSVTTRS